MAANAWRERWDLAQSYIITTGAASANIQLPSHISDPGQATAGSPNTQVVWRMFVSGTAANFNFGATNAVTATAANTLVPIGGDDAPKFMQPGWYAGIANPTTNAGQIFFVPCFFAG
jgi:hypothetical protein